MPNPRLTAIITALMLSGATMPLYADYTLDQLRQIEHLVIMKDTAGLGRLLATDPRLAQGEDPLARELRGFLSCYERGRLNCFASPRVVQVVKGQAEITPAAIY